MLKAILTIGVLQILTVGVQVARAKVISVELGPSGLGIIGLIDQILITLVQVGSLSLPTVALRLLPRLHGTDAGAFQRQYAAFLKAVVIATAAGSGLAALAVYFRPGMLGEELAAYRVEVLLALIGGPVMALGILLPNVLAASQRPSGAAGLGFGTVAVAGIAAWAGLFLGGIRDIYILQLVLGGTLIGLTLVHFKRSLHLPFYDAHGSLTDELRRRPDIIPSAAVTYLAVAGSALSLLAVRYVTVRTLGIETVGWLQAILSMVLAVGTVLMAMNSRYLGPLLNRPSESSTKAHLTELFRRRQLMLLTVMAVPLVLFADIALALMFSRQFVGAAVWLPLFLVWQLLIVQANVQQQLLFALDDLWSLGAVTVTGHAISGILCFVLVPPFGLTGAAAAMLSGGLVMLVLGAGRLRHRHAYAMHGSFLWLASYIVAALLGAPYALGILGPGWNTGGVRLVLCLGLIAGLWFFLDDGEKTALRTRRWTTLS